MVYCNSVDVAVILICMVYLVSFVLDLWLVIGLFVLLKVLSLVGYLLLLLLVSFRFYGGFVCDCIVFVALLMRC